MDCNPDPDIDHDRETMVGLLYAQYHGQVNPERTVRLMAVVMANLLSQCEEPDGVGLAAIRSLSLDSGLLVPNGRMQ